MLCWVCCLSNIDSNYLYLIYFFFYFATFCSYDLELGFGIYYANCTTTYYYCSMIYTKIKIS